MSKKTFSRSIETYLSLYIYIYIFKNFHCFEIKITIVIDISISTFFKIENCHHDRIQDDFHYKISRTILLFILHVAIQLLIESVFVSH